MLRPYFINVMFKHMDFTLEKYKLLLKSLLDRGYRFQTFEQFLQNPVSNVIILRHDVDLKANNSLETAKIENSLGIVGSYYFRVIPQSYNLGIIKQIAALGHEIGYHYETMDTSSAKLSVKSKKLEEGLLERLIDAAYVEFCENLDLFRKVYPVKTICMHGSPKSVFDNKDVWKKYDYKKLGIIGEPYFDIDFDKFFYLTDTGRCWNGYRFSVRDKMPQQERWIKEGLVFRTTLDIVNAVKVDKLPKQIMITVHPQRWSNNYFEWSKELIAQRLKNIVKWGLIKLDHR